MTVSKTRTIDPEAKREKILHFAHRLFVDRGYHRVSIPTIVEASGISTGAIYNLFGNKENIARALHQNLTNRFMDQFHDRLRDRTTTYGKLRAFAELVYELTETAPDMMEYMLFMRHADFMDDMAPVCMTEPFRIIRSIVQDGMVCGDVKPGDYFVSAVSFTGAILRPAQLCLECVLPKPLSDTADEFIDNAWSAIRA